METKVKRRLQRKRRVRAKVFGTADRPRLTVFKSGMHIYAQIVNDEIGKTIASANDFKLKKAPKSEVAALVGEELAKKAVAKKVKKVSFDRNGYIFHGRIKSLADGARKGGLEF